MELKIEYVPVDSINEYDNNAREHSKEDVAAIAKSITEFGFNDPIGVWNNTIVEGHGRLLAARELGLDTVPIIRLDDLTDEQRRAYGLAHNKTAELSRWDADILEAELSEICEIDMSQFGFAELDEEKERKDLSSEISEQWQVIIDCEDETEQADIYERLTGEGLNCRVLTL